MGTFLKPFFAMQNGEPTSCESYFQGFPHNKNMTPHRETSEQK